MKRARTAICLVFLCMVAFEGFGQELHSPEKIQNEALVYPNPLFGSPQFIVTSETVISKVEVLNVIGKVINRTENNNFKLKQVTVFVGKCEKGIYFVKVTFEDNTKIIKKLLVK